MAQRAWFEAVKSHLVILVLALCALGTSPQRGNAADGYWTPNTIGTSCYSTLYGAKFGDGIAAAIALWQCAYSSYPGPRCYYSPTSSSGAICRATTSLELPGASSDYDPLGNEMWTDAIGADIARPSTSCEYARNQPQANETAGNPVVIGSGRKVEYTIDWSSGGEDPLILSRQYSSFASMFSTVSRGFSYSRLGKSWRTNFDGRAGYDLTGGATTPYAANTGDRIQIALPNGLQYSYRKTSGGAWQFVIPTPAAGAGTITWVVRTDVDVPITVTSAGVSLRMPDGTDYQFNNAGLLVQIRYPGGYTQYLEYSGTLNTRVYDSHGRSITFEYMPDQNLAGYLKSAILPDQTRLEFTYILRVLPEPGGSPIPAYSISSNWAYGLESVTYPDNTPGSSADNPRLTYQYWQNSRYAFHLTGIVDERSIQHGAWTYDSIGRVLTSQHEGGADLTTFAYDDVNKKVTVTNPLGRSTVYSYQIVNGSVQRLLRVDGIATANCAASNTVYTYDANGFRASATDAESRVTQWTNNSRGLPTSTTQGVGTAEAVTTTATWDTARQLPASIVRPGATAAFTYTTGGKLATATTTDTTTTTVPYSTNGQTRTTTYTYTSWTPPAPPAVGPVTTPLSDVALTITNPDATSGTTGWTNAVGGLGTRTTDPCSVANPCFTGGTSAQTTAYQDITLTAGQITEVDNLQRAAKVTWIQNSLGETDEAVVRLLFLNSGGTVLGSAPSPYKKPAAWINRERVFPIPTGTRTIRVQMMMARNSGTPNDGFVDDIAVTLVADGDAATSPYVRLINPDSLATVTTGWTVSPGTVTQLTSSPCATVNCFRDGTTGTDQITQNVALPSSRNSEIDGSARSLELKWFDRANVRGRSVSATVDFLDGSGTSLLSSPFASTSETTYEFWGDRSFRVDVPPLARTARVALRVTQTPGLSSTGAYFTGVSAQLLPRTGASDPVELLTSVNGPLPGASDTVTYQYDTMGLLAQVTDEVSHVTQISSRNPRGLPTTLIDENGIATTLAYDIRGRLTTVTVNPGANQSVTAIEYDAASQVTKITAPDSSYLLYTWNNARRLTTITNNAGEKIEYTHNANGDVTSTTTKASGGTIVQQQSTLFDELGRLMRMIGAASQQWDFDYDRTDLLTQVTDPRSNLYAYAYDALQRLIRETDQESAQVNYTLDRQNNLTAYKDPRTITTTYVRNGFGEVIQEASPDAGTTVLVRDQRGLVTQQTDGRGIVANMTYDAAGRLQTATYPADGSQNVSYAYDATTGGNKGIGRLTSQTDGSGSMAWVYDAQGRITSETRTIASQSYTTAYVYDAAGYISQVTYPSGRIVSYTRNALGQVTLVTTQANGGAPVLGIASSITWSPMSGLMTGMTHGNGLQTSATYDLDERLTARNVVNGGTTISGLTYTYGDGINLTGIADSVVPGNSVTLGYSAANRLTTATGPWGTASYSFDGTGNRLTDIVVAGGVTTTRLQSYASVSNRITGMTENGTTIRTYAYDGNGNIVTDTRPGEVFAFTYNVRNRPVALTRNGTGYATYVYNALEQLVSRVTSAPGGPAGTVHYIYDLDGHLIAEADGSTGTTLRDYIWLGDLPLGLAQGGSLYMVHADHLARPILVTDGSRAPVWQAVWRPWGDAQSIAGTLTLDMRFPGQLFQIEAGLHYNWHRHYDPVTGRYTQPDPLRFVDGPSVYAYAMNSPIQIVDEEGGAGRRGERGTTGGSSGKQTANPYKHCKEHPTDSMKIRCRDHQTGKWITKPKPADWPGSESNKMCGESCTDEATAVAMLGGSAYILYRCIRMIPSIFAPPTIPLNALVP
ncbi:MAG: RHS repeat-associated core domain-containing protein [Hyphomicrobiales bacterium]